MAQQQIFRLHVGGLGPSVVTQDLERRFAAFGTVIKVEGVGKLDANGSPLKYAFVDMLSSDAQIKRCMNLLSGTTYKGSTLRIAPARPDYAARAERAAANLPPNTFADPSEQAMRDLEEKAARKLEKKLAKFNARKQGIEGYESSNMELMSIKKFKSRQGVNGWKKDPETFLPIFPILTRPLHPLPSLETSKFQDDQDDNSKDAPAPTQVPTRARRIRIDPTVYRAAIKNRKTHILGPRAISIEQYKLGFSGGAKDVQKSQATKLLWECQLGKDGNVVWRLTNSSDLVQEEHVSLSGYTLQKLRGIEGHYQLRSLDHQPTEHSRVSPSYHLKAFTSSGLSQDPASPQRHLNTIHSICESSTSCAKQDIEPHKFVEGRGNVPYLHLDVSSAIDQVSELSSKKGHLFPRDQVECFPSSNSENLIDLSSAPTLRLKGGASFKPPFPSQIQLNSPNHTSSSLKALPVDLPMNQPDNTSAVQLAELTDMFKAKEAEKTGFRLTDVLGEMELDEDILEVHAESESDVAQSGPDFQSENCKDNQLVKSKIFIHSSRLCANVPLQSQSVDHVKQGKRKGPVFFYPTNEDQDSKVINSLLSTEHREAVRQHWLSTDPASSSDSWRTFCRTESRSEIDTAHDEKKYTLTEQMRRKHKDAMKRDRKWGNRQTTCHKTGADVESDSST